MCGQPKPICVLGLCSTSFLSLKRAHNVFLSELGLWDSALTSASKYTLVPPQLGKQAGTWAYQE